MSNITKAIFTGGVRATAQTALWQWDYGQILVIEGLDLPATYQVHFCNEGDTSTIQMLGTADGVEIPDQFLQTGRAVLAYIYLHTGADDGETEYKITIPVMARPQPTDIEPTPQQQSVIDQLVAELETTKAYVESVADDITLVSIDDGILTFTRRNDT